MGSRRALAVSTLAATAMAAASGPGIAGAADEDDKSTRLAEAQFQLYLLTNSDLVPTDITCTRPPVRDRSGELLCYALVSARQSVAAIATQVSPGVYTFTPLNKIDPALVGEVTPPDLQAPAPQNDVDQAILGSIDRAVADTAGLTTVLVDNNDSITSVDLIAYHAPTSTVQVSVSSGAAEAGARDAVAFYVTDVMAFLWMQDEPLRDATATIHPRLEVSVDGEIYGTPFAVMAEVADYTITQSEWIAIVTGTTSPVKDGTKQPPKSAVKSSAAKPPTKASIKSGGPLAIDPEAGSTGNHPSQSYSVA